MFVELHARSAFSFLEAAALPEALAERAAALGQPSIALLDADGVYGGPRLYRARTPPRLSARGGAGGTPAPGRGPAPAPGPARPQRAPPDRATRPAAARRAHVHPRARHARGGGPAARAQQRALHEERPHHGAALLRLPGGGGEHRRAGHAARLHPEGPGLPLPRVPAAARGGPDRLPS